MVHTLQPSSPTSFDRSLACPEAGPSRIPGAVAGDISDGIVFIEPDSGDSSDEDERVFFGSHDPREREILEGLAGSPLPASPIGSRRQSSGRIRKRDSRDCLRRKTLLSSSIRANATSEDAERISAEKKRWNGGFFERDLRPDTDDEEEPSTPAPLFRHASPPSMLDESSDLTFDFSRFRISDSPITIPRQIVLNSPESDSEGETSLEDDDLSAEGNEETSEESFNEDSDKENAAVPMDPGYEEEGQESYIFCEDVAQVMIGMGLAEPFGAFDVDDDLEGLDLGGLCLADFDDPEIHDQALSADDADTDLGGSSDEGSPPLRAMASFSEVMGRMAETKEPTAAFQEDPAAVHSAGIDILADDAPSSTSSPRPSETSGVTECSPERYSQEPECPDQTSLDPHFTATESSPSPSSVRSSVMRNFGNPSPEASLAVSLAAPDSTRRTRSDARSATPASQSSSSDPFDSPIPQLRGGPVIIPHLPHLAMSMRAESGSPYRPLPPTALDTPAEIELETVNDTTIKLSVLESPSSSRHGTEASMTPLPVVASAEIPANDNAMCTPLAKVIPEVTGAHLPDKSRSLKPALATSLLTASVDRPKTLTGGLNGDKRSAARAQAIRGQLDSAFKVKSAMGPPQRSTSVATSTSSSNISSSSRAPQHSARPLASAAKVRESVSEPNRPKSAVSFSSTFKKPLPRSSSTKSATGTTRPAHSATTLAQSTAAARLPTTKSAQMPLPRPPLVPRLNPPMATARRPVPSQPLASIRPMQKQVVVGVKPVESQATSLSNPLKRPLPVVSATASIAIGATAAPRPTLGPPSRVASHGSHGNGSHGSHAAVSLPAPVFSIGSGGNESSSYRPFRSPGRLGLASRSVGTPSRLGTPSRAAIRASGTPSRHTSTRALGTPSQAGLPFRAPSLLSASNAPTAPRDEAPTIQSSSTSDAEQREPAAAETEYELPTTRQSSEPVRGSSEDHEDVSFALHPASSELSSSPTSDAPARNTRASSKSPVPSPEKPAPPSDAAHARPKRSIKPPAPPPAAPVAKSRPFTANAASIAPAMSEKELKTATQRNTSRNEVYFCAIDRQIVRRDEPRPPSPTSKIRTVADKDEAEKKAGRDKRAKRRLKDEDEDALPLVETIERARGPGDDDDYKTPARPAKKPRTSHTHVSKNVRWDRGLVLIRDDGRPIEIKPCSDFRPGKSALKSSSLGGLDCHGNVVDAKGDQLKRQKIVVTAVFYEGEEPVPVNYNPVPAEKKGGKGKKK